MELAGDESKPVDYILIISMNPAEIDIDNNIDSD